jgi:micrococcal nuclease
MFHHKASLSALVFVSVASLSFAAGAEEIFAGPVPAAVMRILDGDTLEVQAHLWPGLELTQRVRVRGIDAPELHSTCADERAWAAEARDRLVALVGDTVTLARISRDKYGERVDADVINAAGTDVSTAMIGAGMARAYDGGARGDWCPVGSVGAGH